MHLLKDGEGVRGGGRDGSVCVSSMMSVSNTIVSPFVTICLCMAFPRYWCPVRRQVFLPRRACRAPAASRRVVPSGSGGVVLGRPANAGEDN
jgi:hypothetical protein